MRLKIVIDILQTAYIYLWVIVSTLIGGLCAVTVSFFDRRGNAPHLVARAWASSILFVAGIKVTVRGLENLDPNGTYIFMPNHQSNFDIPVLLSWLPFQFRWLAKAELFKIPLFGYAMRRAGYIPIDRSRRTEAFRSLANAAAAIRQGRSVIIFPEGTRSRDQSIKPFKKGGFVMAVDAGVPIVPIVLHGTRAIMSSSGRLIRSGRVVMEIFEPIATTDYTRKTKDDLMARVYQIIHHAFESQHESNTNAENYPAGRPG